MSLQLEMVLTLILMFMYQNNQYNKRKMRILIIIPTFNEKQNIVPLVNKINLSFAADILFIDDNSPDGTANEIKKCQDSNSNVFIIEREGKMGLASAYITGFHYAIEKQYDCVFQMDADFSHNPVFLADFINALEGADLVIGSRYIPGGGVSNWNRVRRLISKGGNLYAKFILRLPILDVTGGFKCFKINTLKKIYFENIKSDGYSFQIEMNYLLHKNGFKLVEIPIVFEERREGSSKMSSKIFFEAIFKVIKMRFSHYKIKDI